MKSKKPNNQNRWQEIREEKGSIRKRDARNPCEFLKGPMKSFPTHQTNRFVDYISMA
jgi:hypothetical protein